MVTPAAWQHLEPLTFLQEVAPVPRQREQKTTCLTASSLQRVSQSSAIYVSGDDTISLFNCLFSYQDWTTSSDHLSEAAHEYVLAIQQLHNRGICF